MQRGEGLAVHLPGQQHLRRERLREGHGASERLHGLGIGGQVGSQELDVRGTLEDARRGQHVPEPDPGPGGGTRRPAVPGRLARDVAHGEQAGAAVAGALQRRHQLVPLEPGPEVGQRQGQLGPDEAVDGEPPGLRVEVRHRPVVAAVERVDRGEGRPAERSTAGFRVVRLPLVDEHVLAFALHPCLRPRRPSVGHRPVVLILTGEAWSAALRGTVAPCPRARSASRKS